MIHSEIMIWLWLRFCFSYHWEFPNLERGAEGAACFFSHTSSIEIQPEESMMVGAMSTVMHGLTVCKAAQTTYYQVR